MPRSHAQGSDGADTASQAQSGDRSKSASVTTVVLAPNAFGIDTTNHLVRFNTATPGSIVGSLAVAGLQPAENVLAIDFRPVNDTLYALGSTSRLYILNQTTGLATVVGSGPFTPGLSGTEFGFDVDPTTDRIRITSNTGQNLRLNADTGAVVATDNNLAYAPADTNFGVAPQIAGSGYANSSPGATTTTLYAIDSNLDILATQDPPNAGTLHTIGPLGVNASAVLGFDIFNDGSTDSAFATLVVGATPGLYSIDLTSGAATLVGAIGGGATLRGLAVAPLGFTASLSGSAVTFTGTAASDTIIFDQAGGLLRHNRFSFGDAGFSSGFDFDPTTPGDQTLSATDPAVTVTVNAGLRDDQITIGSTLAPSAGLAPSFAINGQGGNDQLTIDDVADSIGRSVTLNSGSVTGMSGQITYGTLDSLIVKAGTGDDNISVGANTPHMSIFAGGGNDNIGFLGGGAFAVDLIDGGTGNNTLDYSNYSQTSLPSIDLTQNKQLFLARLSATQETGPLSASSASGNGVFVLNPNQTRFAFDIFYRDLEGGSIISNGTNFQEAPFGQTGPVRRALTLAEQNGLNYPQGFFSGVWRSIDPQALSPALVAELQANNIYFNLATNTFPSGEIRGQLIAQGAVGTATGAAGVRNIANAGPALSINDVSVIEGNGGFAATNAVFTVTLSQPASHTVTVSCQPAEGTADNSDFQFSSPTATFAPGEVTATCTIPITGDTNPEGDEFFFVNLLFPNGALIGDGQGIGTIIDDDPGGTLQFASSIFSVNENNGTATINVTRTGSLVGTVTVDYATSNGTASAGEDYGNTAGTLSFGPGVTSRTFDVPILDDSIVEGTESVNLTLSGATGGASIGTQNTATLLISEDESPRDTFAVTVTNRLLSFRSEAPQVVNAIGPITGLQAGETIVGIDVRPGNGQLYAVGNNGGVGRLYTINTTNAAATLVATLTADPTDASSPYAGLNGSDFGVDFNPVADRLRVVSDTDQNLRINPANGQVITDTGLAYASGDLNFGSNPNIVAAAYTNNVPGATTTTLYGIDSNLDFLATQNPPNNGTLNSVGALTVNTRGVTGFDIRPSNNVGFASLTAPGDTLSKFYTIDLATGNATLLGPIGGTELVRDIALAPPVGLIQFSAASASVSEGAGKVTLTVTRTGNSAIPASVKFATNDGTAVQKGDYTIALGTLQFAPGETSKTFDLLIVDDGFAEGPESFTVDLSSPTGDFAISGNTSATVNITDNDPVPSATNPIDVTSFFVRQQYLDFLNREPDASGFAFWSNEINSCGTNNQCIAVKRINVSAAFFLSIEFQETGGNVLRIQRAAFGQFSNDAATRTPYLQFMRDARQVGLGVIVGQAGYQTVLENNKQAYAMQVVTSPAFIAKYSLSMNASTYVNALFSSARIFSPPTSERNAAIAAFGAGGTPGRVAALRSVADSNSVRKQELNPSFVLMEYYGYVRRNSTDPPDDSDDNGYSFWLGKLNDFKGDFVQAEMVKAFLSSTEYRQRFGAQ
ncbi:MAG: DUF4394 domain-containing protein [Pyrinomonadaceae bacterium]